MTEQSQSTSIDELLTELQNSKDAYVRSWVVNKLGEQTKDNERVLSALRIVAQSDANKSVRDSAKSVLRKSGEKFESLDKEELKIWQVVGIGILIPLTVIILYVLYLAYDNLRHDWQWDFGAVLDMGHPFFVMIGGVSGALIGNAKSGTKRWSFVGGILGTIVGIVLGFLYTISLWI